MLASVKRASAAPHDIRETNVTMDERSSRRGRARRPGGWIRLACAAALGVALTGVAGSAGAETLRSRLDRLAARGPLAAATVGIHVEDAETGQVLYSRGGDRLLIPASNQKILTALAALHRFGPAHRFRTRIWAPAEPGADGVVPRLMVEGGGDPALNSEDWWRLAADLRREGLRGVRGDLLVDDSRFEAPGWHPSWGRVSSRAYHAPVGALTANYGTFFVAVRPQRAGSAAEVYVDPPVDYLRLRNRVRTVPRDAKAGLRVDRLAGSRAEGLPPHEIVQVDGATRQGDDVDLVPRSVQDPALYAGSLLAMQLEANGIFLDGGLARAQGKGHRGVLLLEHSGRPLSEIVELCMKYSNNSIAETLVKNLAAHGGADPDADLDRPSRRGTWIDGVRAMRRALGEAGVRLDGARLVDGSGLSIANRVSPAMLVEALRAGHRRFGLGAEFLASMPIAGLDGTLEKRLAESAGRLRAKTGLLGDARVASLSGFAERQDGRLLAFSILVNGHAGGSGGAMDAVDALAATLLEAPLPRTARVDP